MPKVLRLMKSEAELDRYRQETEDQVRQMLADAEARAEKL